MSEMTLSNCINIPVHWGGYLVNLFAGMANNPNDMKPQSDPVSTKNDQAIGYILSIVNYVSLPLGMVIKADKNRCYHCGVTSGFIV
jgi:hypothetical protein